MLDPCLRVLGSSVVPIDDYFWVVALCGLIAVLHFIYYILGDGFIFWTCIRRTMDCVLVYISFISALIYLFSIGRYYLLQIRHFVYAGLSLWVVGLLAGPSRSSTPGRDSLG